MGQARDGNSLEAQESALRQAGAERIFRDVYSSLTQVVQLLETLSERGIIVEVLNMGVIDDTATGRLIRNIMLSFSEFEHDMIV